MKKLKVAAAGLGVVAVLAAIVAGAVLGPYATSVRHVKADPARGFHADFFLYVSPGARDAAAAGQPVTLLVQPNNSGTNSDDPNVHTDDAWWTGFERHYIADDLHVALLVPAFLRPATDWHIYSHALDRDVFTTARPDLARLDLQLLAMIRESRAMLAKEGIDSEEKILLQGFSASGMFANRFAALHPSQVRAAAVGSPGGWPIVPATAHADEPLAYPAGVADLEFLTGAPFDAAAFNQVPQLIFMGALDGNDSVDFRDGWDEAAAVQLDRLFGTDPLARWPQAEKLYRNAGSRATFVLVDGVGHDRPALQDLGTEFFRQVLSQPTE